MNLTLKGGIYIGVLCALWTLVMEFTGWYKHPALQFVFFFVIVIQIGVLVWGLKQTATTNSFMGQVKAGSLMSVYAGVFLFVFSMLLTSVFFPHYFEDIREMYTNMYMSAGLSGAELTTKVDELMTAQTSFKQALSGLIGTVVTGVIVSLIIGAFYRKK